MLKQLRQKIEQKDFTDLERFGYKTNNRRFVDVQRFFFNGAAGRSFICPAESIVYRGYEHNGKPKLPNITVIGDIQYSSWQKIMGSTFGHQHTQKETGDSRKFQEVYEFQGYGGMFIRKKKESTFYLLSPGEKVTVGTEENMAIFNLGNEPLVTLDYANPEMNAANKNLESKVGTSMMCLFNGASLDFHFNEKYHANEIITSEYNPIILPLEELGENLIKRFKEERLREQFFRCGVNVVLGGNYPASAPLIDLLEAQNSPLARELQL